MLTVLDTPDCKLFLGSAHEFDQIKNPPKIDFVFTSIQAPMPRRVMGSPMVIHMGYKHRTERDRAAKLSEWMLGKLPRKPFTTYNDGESFLAYNMQDPVLDLSHYRHISPGWWSEDLVRDVLKTCAKPGDTIWDGFMGRGTVGKVARELGMSYVGIEIREEHMTLAREFMGV